MTEFKPEVGMKVRNPKNDCYGKVIGLHPPGAMAQGSGWDVLIKWNSPALQDTWHDAGDLDWSED